MWKLLYATPLSRIYVGLTPKTTYIGMCTKSKSFWSFPSHGSNSFDSWPSLCLEIAQILPFITPLKGYIRNPLVHWRKQERIESKETIVHCCQNLCLSLHPFVPWSTSVFFPSLLFSCELAIERWRIEVVEAQVGDLVSPVWRRVIRGCIL